MHFTKLTLLAAAGAFAAPAYNPFPLSDGFPSPSASQLKQIEAMAGGTLPNGALPSSLTAAATVTLQLIALNEIFEVAYFTDLLNNVTFGSFDMSGYDTTSATAALKAIVAQEQIHALGINAILANAGQKTISPCKYMWPVTTFAEAIALAQTFTDVVLGILPIAQVQFGSDGGDELPLVQLIGSAIAQEGEQTGWFRSLQGKTPSAAPFLTSTGSPAFAFSALQMFIVPDSCEGVDIVKESVPTFAPLTVVSGALPENSTVTYSVPGSYAVSAATDSVLYLSGQNVPVVVSISEVYTKNGMTFFNALLPFSTGFNNGLTIAAVIKCVDHQFTKVSDAIPYVKFGPGLIEQS